MHFARVLWAMVAATLLSLVMACATTSLGDPPTPTSPFDSLATGTAPGMTAGPTNHVPVLTLTPEPDSTGHAPASAQNPAMPRPSLGPVQRTEARPTATAQADVLTPACLGADGVREIRAEYAANSVRAIETYVGEQVCVRGKISGFRGWRNSSTRERFVHINVAVGDGSEFALVRGDIRNGSDWQEWRDWALTRNVGDTVEAECRVKKFALVKGSPRGTTPVPVFTNCQRVGGGVIWTPQPSPTPTLGPCGAAGYGERSYQWLTIDCAAGRVAIGWNIAAHDREWTGFLFEGDSTTIAFYTIVYDEDDWSDDRYEHHASWERVAVQPQDRASRAVEWEAPPDVAAIIISQWRRGNTRELIVLFGECCEIDTYFDLTSPLPPFRALPVTPAPWPTSTPTPAPTSTPTSTPTRTPIPTPTPTATAVPTPNPELLAGVPLTASFIAVPSSHDGNGPIQFQLRFTEPVSTSYKVLRDEAIWVENGTVKESRRVDGRNDLWMVTVEPDGNEDMVVTLTAPEGCGHAASVCTEAGKALANRPTARVPYEG